MTTFCPSTYPVSFRPSRNAVTRSEKSCCVVVPRNPTTGTVGRCACAANGQVTAALPTRLMNSRRLITAPEAWTVMVATPAYIEEGDVRFGSKADMCGARAHVRFTPESD